jgi:hypothetical protein
MQKKRIVRQVGYLRQKFQMFTIVMPSASPTHLNVHITDARKMTAVTTYHMILPEYESS